MKKLLITLALALMIAVSVSAEESPAPPVFSIPGGIYKNTLYITLRGSGEIYYTLDGSVPTTSSYRYEMPIAVSPTTTELQVGGGWRDQNVETVSVPSGTVIRAAVIVNGESSRVVDQVYFIGRDVQSFFGDLPMANLTVDPYDLWDPMNGIYSNYNYEHKVPSSFQYINTLGVCDINRTTTVKVSGHGSRSNPKKSLRVYFKNTDPDQGKYLEYPLIPNNFDSELNLITTYSKVTFRISDYQYTDLRDVVAQKLGGATSADTAASTPMALFLNGEFWGMYECREQYDDDYVATHYGLDNDDIVFLDRDWTLDPQMDVLPDTGTMYTDKIDYSSGPADDNKKGRLGESYYREQWRYIQSLCTEKDITDPAVYAEFCAAVDVDSFMDFLIVYIYCANDDWPGNNFKFWRVTEESIDPEKYGADGKWRFMIHDFDIAFENSRHNTLELSAFARGGIDDARHPRFATRLLDGLLRNPDFRNEFAQRTMAYMDTNMSAESVANIVENLIAQRKDGKYADLLRWGWGPSQFRLDFWIRNMQSFNRFASERRTILANQYTDLLNSHYNANITGEAQVRLITAFASGSSETYYSIDGVGMGVGGGNSYSVFSGIPVTVSARRDDGADVQLQVIYSGGVVTGANEITFVPSKDETCTITAVMMVSPAAGPATHVVGFARPVRFSMMTVGEALPPILVGSDGSRLEAAFSVAGDCAVIDEKGMVKAIAPGTGILYAEYGGQIYFVNIVVQ